MRHVGAIAGRELSAFFASPVAYVVLTLWSVLAGTFFLSNVLSFHESVLRAQQFQDTATLAAMNLNDSLITPFIGAMWVVLLFLLPAVTMGLFSDDRRNGTDELLLTSPITIWEIVLGKYLAAFGFASLMMLIVAFFPALLFAYGDPELGTTAAGLLGLLLVSATYCAVGAFASSLTRSQLIAFILGLVLLLVLGMMLPFLAEVMFAGPGGGSAGALGDLMRYIATGVHLEALLGGVVDTSDLTYFAVSTATFLLLAKAAVESARWR